MENLLTPEMVEAVRGIDLSNPETIKAAAIALAVMAVWKGSLLFAKLLFKAARFAAGKTKTTLDDDAVAKAETEFQKKYGN